MPSFTKEQIRQFLAEGGYTTNPLGLVLMLPTDFVYLTEDSGYLDVNADAVRQGDEVPDRPIRVEFRKIYEGPSVSWILNSVEELAPGVETNAMDRQPETPKISPWPNLNLDVGRPCPKGCGGKLQEVAGGIVRCDSCGEQYRFHGKPPTLPEPPGRR
jgi:hypothetical protein